MSSGNAGAADKGPAIGPNAWLAAVFGSAPASEQSYASERLLPGGGKRAIHPMPSGAAPGRLATRRRGGGRSLGAPPPRVEQIRAMHPMSSGGFAGRCTEWPWSLRLSWSVPRLSPGRVEDENSQFNPIAFCVTEGARSARRPRRWGRRRPCDGRPCRRPISIRSTMSKIDPPHPPVLTGRARMFRTK